MDTEERNGICDYNVPPPQPVGIYGWRKRCLYTFLLCLMVVVTINLALTVWILRVLHFSLDGMGRLKIVPKGFQLQGEAEFLRPVYANRVKSVEGKALYVQSNKAVELLATNSKHKITSKLVIDENTIHAKCENFMVEDTKGNKNFVISNKNIILGSSDVSFPGDIKFNASIRTPNIFSPENEPLEISSETSKVKISGAAGVSLLAKTGSISINASDNINMESTTGSIHINSPKVLLTLGTTMYEAHKRAISRNLYYTSTPKDSHQQSQGPTDRSP